MNDFPKVLKNFTSEELACPLTGECKFHPGFPEALQELRDAVGLPLFVESCCRAERHNDTLEGASPYSLHICDLPGQEGQFGTLAVDLRVKNSAHRHEILKHALALGWSGYVMPGGNLHLDRRDRIGKPTIFWHRS